MDQEADSRRRQWQSPEIRSASTDTMIHGKSHLNPYAVPYIPLSKNSSGLSLEGEYKALNTISGDSGKNSEIKDITGYQLPGTASAGYNTIHDAYGVSVSVASSSMMPHETGVTVDSDLILDYLSSMFPDVSIESLAELFKANHGDLSATIDMLEQLELFSGDFDIPETSGINKLDEQGNSSGRNGFI